MGWDMDRTPIRLARARLTRLDWRRAVDAGRGEIYIT
jgi:hypothetical protein